MFEKFGEFTSSAELNEAAQELLDAGDTGALIALASENGIDTEDAQDFIDGCTGKLATPLMAAIGKLKVEEAELEPYEIMADWVDYIKAACMEEPEMQKAVRKKGKSLRGCIAELLKWGLEYARPVDRDILSACNIKYKVTLGIPGAGTARKIIKRYYLGGKKNG